MLMRVQTSPQHKSVLVNGSTFKAGPFEAELSAVQPPLNPKGTALQTCSPAVPLKIASPSSHQAPHHYIGGHISEHRGKVRRGKSRKCLSKRPLWWAWPLVEATTPLREATSIRKSLYLHKLSQGLHIFLDHPTSTKMSGTRFPSHHLWRIFAV